MEVKSSILKVLSILWGRERERERESYCTTSSSVGLELVNNFRASNQREILYTASLLLHETENGTTD